jgi:hypothetical protein
MEKSGNPGVVCGLAKSMLGSICVIESSQGGSLKRKVNLRIWYDLGNRDFILPTLSVLKST